MENVAKCKKKKSTPPPPHPPLCSSPSSSNNHSIYLVQSTSQVPTHSLLLVLLSTSLGNLLQKVDSELNRRNKTKQNTHSCSSVLLAWCFLQPTFLSLPTILITIDYPILHVITTTQSVILALETTQQNFPPPLPFSIRETPPHLQHPPQLQNKNAILYPTPISPRPPTATTTPSACCPCYLWECLLFPRTTTTTQQPSFELLRCFLHASTAT